MRLVCEQLICRAESPACRALAAWTRTYTARRALQARRALGTLTTVSGYSAAAKADRGGCQGVTTGAAVLRGEQMGWKALQGRHALPAPNLAPPVACAPRPGAAWAREGCGARVAWCVAHPAQRAAGSRSVPPTVGSDSAQRMGILSAHRPHETHRKVASKWHKRTGAACGQGARAACQQRAQPLPAPRK